MNVPGEGWLLATATDAGGQCWPDVMQDYAQFMCAPRGNKNAYAPWGDRNHPDGDPAKDARYKWALPDVWGDFDTARNWATKDPTLSSSLMFILQRESDPYRNPTDPLLLIDGDDVVDGQGRVHPEFRELVDDLADEAGYAALSSSGHGIHVPLIGRLPDGVKQLKIPLSPDVEHFSGDHIDNEEGEGIHVDIFDGKHLWKATGNHIPGTPRECASVDETALAACADEFGASLTVTTPSGDSRSLVLSSVSTGHRSSSMTIHWSGNEHSAVP